MTNVILCGGSGTRLWPISRTLMPKQFIKLFDNKSLFELTISRNQALCENTIIVSNDSQYFIAKDMSDALNIKANYILESIGKNTAPAIALAAFSVDKDEILLVTPADHLIRDSKAYQNAISQAKALAQKNDLITFGIKPLSAQTGFGYIESTSKTNDVVAFHEKPSIQKAQDFIKKGNYYWNSGMFMFKAGVFLDALKLYAKDIYDASFSAYTHASKESNLLRITPEYMEQIPSNSIDYAVMESAKNVKMIPADMGWSDVGSFDALYSELEKDKDGNTKMPNLIAIDSVDNLVISQNSVLDKAIALIDMKDTIVIDTGDALLVSKKGSSQKVKQVVEQISSHKNSDLATTHLTTYRPWGSYTILEVAPGYKIKRIVVNPGARLSLQKHFHRNEHWIVVSGTASVSIDGIDSVVRPNESIYIKMGQTHRLANDGKIPIVLIEAQVGQYTGEDDIVRLADDFNRK